MKNTNNKNSLKDKIVSGVIWKFGERIFAQVVSFVVSIILARMLTPHEYGVVTMVTIFIVIADVFVTSGLGTSLIQKKEVSQLEFSTIFYCSLILSGILYCILFFSAPLIAVMYKNKDIILILRVFALKIPISAFNSVQVAYVSRRMDFKKFFFSTSIGTFISAVVGITMALYGFGVWALVAQYLSNAFIDTTVLFFTVKWRPKREFSIEVAKPLVRYGWKIMATDLIGTICNQMNSFIVGVKYTDADLGYYSKGRSFPELVNNNIFSALISVLFPAMSKLSDDKIALKKLIKNSQCIVSFLVFPLMVGMIVTAPSFIEVLLTKVWSVASIYVQITCLTGFFSVVATINLQVLKAIGRSEIVLKLEFIKKPIYLISVIFATKYGVIAIAYTVPFIALFEMILNAHYVKKYVGYSLKNQLWDLRKILLISIVMGAIVYGVSYIKMPVFILLCFQVMIGCGVYLILAYLFKIDALTDVQKILKKNGE